MEQYFIVGALVLLCTLYLVRKYVFKPKNSGSACGGCDRCGGGKGGGCH